MMEDLWKLFCEQSDCSESGSEACNLKLSKVTDPSSCTNHVLIILFDALLLILLLVNIISKTSSKKTEVQARCRRFSMLRICSAVLNGGLGLVYIGLGIWNVEENMRNDHSVVPVHWWVLYVQGGTWMLVGLTVSFRGMNFSKAPLRLLANFAFLSAGISCILALYSAVINHEVTVKVALDIVTVVGATLILLCTYKGYENGGNGEINNG